jgi:hypothetical protein
VTIGRARLRVAPPARPNAVRRGDINWNGNTPWIYVWGPAGGNADMMTNDMDCDHLTHPDFTQSGDIRGTSMLNNQFKVVNLPVY